MQNDIFSDVRVTPVLKEFFVCVNNGSDIIIPKKKGALSYLVSSLLTLPPNNFELINNRAEYLRVKLYTNESYKLDARNYLDKQAQSIICNYLNSGFKSIFHNYVYGFISNGGKLKDAIEDFCEMYNISYNNITYEMLKKSWFRSSERQRYLNPVSVPNIL